MKHTVHNPELTTRLMNGINTVANAVVATMGKGGHNVLFLDDLGALRSTKDGVTVAKSITNLEDPVSDMGATLIREAAAKTAKIAGDGTTTATLLASRMAQDALKRRALGDNAIELKRGMESAKKSIEDYLKKLAHPIKDKDEMKMIALISSNGDEEISNAIVEGIDAVGSDGVVSLEESRYGDTRLEIVQGIQLERGYISHHFITDQGQMQTELVDPLILLVDGRLGRDEDIIKVMEYAGAQGKPLLVIAENIEGNALSILIVNKLRGHLLSCGVKSPEYGDTRTKILEDIAIITRGIVFSEKKGTFPANFNESMSDYLGTARRVVITNESTTIIDGGYTTDDEVRVEHEKNIEKRAIELKEQLDNTRSDYEKQRLQIRLGRLLGGVAVVHVGGRTDMEIKERKDRAEDALYAVYSARETGYIPGGGVALLRSGFSIKAPKFNSLTEEAGWKIVMNAVTSPYTQILSNAGVNDVTIKTMMFDLIQKKDFWTISDIDSQKVVDSREIGVIDPLKVTLTALNQAVGVAEMVLLTDVAIVEKKENKTVNTSDDEIYG